MSVVLILLAVSLLIAAGFLAAFLWSVKNGQYDDDYTPSVRILFEERTNNDKSNRTHDPHDGDDEAE
jgi:cbb3-type cytochrome oxidase maturation protein